MSIPSIKRSLETLRITFKENCKKWHYDPTKKDRNLYEAFPIIEERIFKYNENNNEEIKQALKRCKKEVSSLEDLLSNKFQNMYKLEKDRSQEILLKKAKEFGIDLKDLNINKTE